MSTKEIITATEPVQRSNEQLSLAETRSSERGQRGKFAQAHSENKSQVASSSETYGEVVHP